MKNLGTKFLILFLAIILWLFIVTGQTYVLEIDVPIQVYEPRDNYMLSQPLPESASVRVRGSGRSILFGRMMNRNSLILDISGISRDETLSLKSYFSEKNNQIFLPERVEFLEIVYPDSIVLKVDKRATRVLPVSFRADVSVSPGYVQVGKTTVQPNYVSVSGPEKLLQELDSARAGGYDFRDVEYDASAEVAIVNEYPEQLVYSPERVILSAGIDMIGEKIFKDVPVAVKNAPEDLDVTVIPAYVTVKVSGANSLLEKMKTDDMYVYYDYLTQWIPGKQFYRMRLVPPNEVLDILDIQPEKCEVVLLKKESSIEE